VNTQRTNKGVLDESRGAAARTLNGIVFCVTNTSSKLAFFPPEL
jgi:hypothetical protein